MAGRVHNAAVGKSILLVGLMFCACACSTPGSGSGSSTGQLLDSGIRPEARAQVEKELAEGPTEDSMSAGAKAEWEKRFGPVLPIVPFRKYRSFFPEKVGSLTRVTLSPMSGLGIPSIDAFYKAESDDGHRVLLRIQDGRQVKGGAAANIFAQKEELGKRHNPSWTPDWKTGNVNGFPAWVMDANSKNQSMTVKVGRFDVCVQADDMKVARQFLDAIDMEKLSKVE